MNLLLDTHVLVWWFQANPRLGPKAGTCIADPENFVWVSAASVWEIAIKSAIGRAGFDDMLARHLPDAIAEDGFRPLSISVDHAAMVPSLPDHHRDPFDRILVAQALAEGLQIVTADRAIAAYPVSTLAADR
ncbi:MAG: type II toxin-antitoxin system VapC family toxin [Kiloniellaceae bacterium]